MYSIVDQNISTYELRKPLSSTYKCLNPITAQSIKISLSNRRFSSVALRQLFWTA